MVRPTDHKITTIENMFVILRFQETFPTIRRPQNEAVGGEGLWTKAFHFHRKGWGRQNSRLKIGQL